MSIQAYAAMEQGGELQLFSYPERDLQPFEAEIVVSHCGICHSDVHLIDNDWGVSDYPLVPGHEIIGTVRKLGSMVSFLEVGQQVGVGWQSGSCMSCDLCVSGQENLCAESSSTCAGNFGGFAERVYVDARFAFPLPKGMTASDAAPLLCGGVTVYSPIRRYISSPSQRIGVIGIGGLGHMALRFAGAYGSEVFAFSSSPSKEAEAKSFGATHFIPSGDPENLEAAEGTLDLLISTAPASFPWDAYLRTLRPNGVLCLVGLPDEPLSFPAIELLAGQRSITASVIGSRSGIREMLDFAARKGIGAQTETMALSSVNEALQKVRNNTARYRMVLEV
jgi:uncharacterized zinc-type alcohol dehydrogenase-like protein